MIILLLLLAQSFALAGEDFSVLEKKMDAFVEKYQPAPNTGIAVGIVRGPELIFFKGYGFRDREKKLPVTLDTRFAIGSVTKNFLSTSMALLEERAQLELAAPVRRYLPTFQLENEEIAKQVTSVDILSHQVGLPRHDLLWYLTPFQTPELFQKLPYLEMDKREGMGFRSGKTQYNNLMFMTAGILLEQVSGKAWQKFVQENFLNSLQMQDTTFDLSGFAAANVALPYAKETKLPYKALDQIGAAGSMNSTVKDMAKWVSLHLAGGEISGQRLIARESLEKLYQPRSRLGAGPLAMEYGLAFMISKIGENRVIHHGGNIDGFSAMVGFAPEKNIGVVVLVNQDGAGNFQYPLLVDAGKDMPPVALFPYLILEHFLSPPMGTSEIYSQSALNDMAIFLERGGSGVRSAGFIGPDGNMVGEFYELAYGKLRLFVGDKGQQLLDYYGNIFELRATAEENKFSVHLPESGEASGMVAEVVRIGSRVESVLMPFEPAVRPIRFIANPTSPE